MSYRYAQYLPLTSSLTFEASAIVGYGNAYARERQRNGRAIGLPFFENYYAGGIADVRNFRDNTLGSARRARLDAARRPQANYCLQPLGGAFKTAGSVELIIPTPFVKDDSATRLSWYVDVGNVYKNLQRISRLHRYSTTTASGDCAPRPASRCTGRRRSARS